MSHMAEVTRGGVWGTVGERDPAPVPPGPEAHQALPRSDISHTWELILRRSSLDGKEGGRGRYEAFQAGVALSVLPYCQHKCIPGDSGACH